MCPRRAKVKRSEQILRTAKAVFARSNFRSSTTSAIAAEAGVSEPLIYRYYPSKKQLFLAVLDDVTRRILQRWDAIRRSEPSSLACLRRIGQDYLDLVDRNSEDLKVFFKAVSEDNDPEIRHFLAESYRKYARYLEDVARRGQQQGEIRGDVPSRIIAWQMMSLGAAFNLFAALGLSEWTRADREAQLLAFLERIREASPPAGAPGGRDDGEAAHGEALARSPARSPAGASDRAATGSAGNSGRSAGVRPVTPPDRGGQEA
ncbi:TetR/AcrR family transcriptional regulator [Thermaerobacter sp. PB12/4term]|uniref:TetR/AcrR family transcriptional regulator n=1 Tax=Thermaerobacter sp. PB12/4term TaxID=2293838 RepID=UPI000E32544C|nr:TetR/AcrR family transcriptional regulator [Thermaerobacter sp. PB12/4term]QIA27663.1 TetR/AcrR family transcriptional regulator [Thermaerobacter sp. PB12/4term]